jgi:uncharacterized membrane protein
MMGFELIIIPLVVCAVVSVLVVVGAIAFAVGWRPGTKLVNTAQNSQTPLDILNARYARGEITREEHAQMRQDLEG